jgi:hypothetical protein
MAGLLVVSWQARRGSPSCAGARFWLRLIGLEDCANGVAPEWRRRSASGVVAPVVEGG